jgi:hypothetical protein
MTCLEVLESALFPPTIEEAIATTTSLRISNLLAIPELKTLNEKCIMYLRDRYVLLKERYTEEDLIAVFEHDGIEKLEEDLKERLKIESRFKDLAGLALDRIEVEHTKIDGGYYPYSSLKQGVAWPDDVDVTRREDYLSPEEFRVVFGLTKEDYLSKAKHVQLRMKKEKLLF